MVTLYNGGRASRIRQMVIRSGKRHEWRDVCGFKVWALDGRAYLFKRGRVAVLWWFTFCDCRRARIRRGRPNDPQTSRPITNEEFLPTRYIVNFLRRSQDENRQIMAIHLRRLIDAHGCAMARKCREHARYLGVYPNGLPRRLRRGRVSLVDYV